MSTEIGRTPSLWPIKPSVDSMPSPGPADRKSSEPGQFFSIIGRVEVQRAGQTLWESAHHKQPVFNGDFVRTGRDGNAEILFADGSLYRISPDSLLEIHNQLSQESPGTVKMVVGRINVYTSGTPSTVTTDSVETEIERDSRVAVDVAGDGQETTVAAFQGSATVRNTQGRQGRRQRARGDRSQPPGGHVGKERNPGGAATCRAPEQRRL